jgi:hypothetical protein
LEEQVRRFGLEGDVANLIDDEQRIPGEPDELGLEPAGVVGLGEPVDPLGCGLATSVIGDASLFGLNDLAL